MNGSSDHDRENALVDKFCEGRLTATEASELESLAANDAEFFDRHITHLYVDAALRWEFSVATTTDFLSHTDALSQEGRQSSVVRSQPVGHALRDNSDPTDSARGACPTPRSKKSWLDRASRRPVRPALAIAALVMISVVAWMGVTMVKTQMADGGKKSTNELQKPTKPEFVAWLMAVHETQWLDGTEPQKTRLMPGQRLAIAKGVIEIQYRTRAVVVIEGPAEFYVGARDSGRGAKGKNAPTSAPSPESPDPKSLANSGYLAHGKLVARVEGEKAKGFTIETATARVEDLGTEFGVEVTASGQSLVRVFEGRIRVHTYDDSPPRELAKDQALVIRRADGGGVYVEDAVAATGSFVRVGSVAQWAPLIVHDNVAQIDAFEPQLNGIAVSKDDLVQAGAATLEAANAIQFVENSNLDFANINDGASEAMGDGVFEAEQVDRAEWIAEFVLDTSENIEGYNITHIDSIASWTRGRIQQRVTVSYSTVDAPDNFNHLLGTFTNIEKVPQTTGASRIRLTDVGGEILASRVKVIRLRYTNHGLGVGYLPVVQEVDVFGSATPMDGHDVVQPGPSDDRETKPTQEEPIVEARDKSE